MTEILSNITEEDLQVASRMLVGSRKISLLTHKNPDGDAIGSLTAFTAALRQMGKDVIAICQDEAPARFKFLHGIVEIAHKWRGDADLVVSLDASDAQQLGDLFVTNYDQSIPLLVIDHHRAGEDQFGIIRLVDPSSSSTCELLFDILSYMNLELTAGIATSLLTGLVNDTNAFRNSSTTPVSLLVASRLMQAGAPLKHIIDNTLDVWPYEAIQILGKGLLATEKYGTVAISAITQDMLFDLGVREIGGAHKAIGNTLMTVGDLDIAAILVEKNPSTTSVSMRSKGEFDISQVALKLGGGGHKNAAGFTVPLSITETRATILPMLQEVARARITS